jgi:hypothetical protein
MGYLVYDLPEKINIHETLGMADLRQISLGAGWTPQVTGPGDFHDIREGLHSTALFSSGVTG